MNDEVFIVKKSKFSILENFTYKKGIGFVLFVKNNPCKHINLKSSAYTDTEILKDIGVI